MSENSETKGSLLLPLGIGAAVLLMMAMKKKQAATATPEAQETEAPPEAMANEPASPQVDPSPAPSYAQAVAKTNTTEQAQPESQEEGEEDNGQTDNASSDEQDNGQDSESDTQQQSFTPYSPKSTINTNQARTPDNPKKRVRTFANGKPVIGKKTPAQQAKLLALPKARMQQAKSLRFQSDQAKKPAMRQTANPLFIGKGKPRIGVAQRPGATVQAAQSIAPVAAKTAVSSTIFPLKFGMKRNPYVREMQKKLGLAANGHFNSATRTRLQKNYKVSEVSEALYKQIITGKSLPKRGIPKILSAVKKILPKRKNVKRK